MVMFMMQLEERSANRLWIVPISNSVNSHTSPDVVDVDGPLGLSASSAVTKVLRVLKSLVK